ncbi:PD-(D/E)XK nuclease family protein [Bacillus sp. AK128]
MNSLICPNCNASLIEDAWENTYEKEDGGIMLDAFLAFVCESQCGYSKRIEDEPRIIAQQGEDRLLIIYPDLQGRILDVRDSVLWPSVYYESILGRGGWEDYMGNHDLNTLLEKARDSETAFEGPPNLFKFATSELSQDAFICWLFEHVRLKTNDTVNQVGSQLLTTLFTKYKKLHPEFEMKNLFEYTLKIEQQKHKIDILLTLTPRYGEEKVYIIIEDKTVSGESRKNQIQYYTKKLKDEDQAATIIPVLFKTGYTTNEKQKEYEDQKIVVFGYREIYELFSKNEQILKDNIILHSWWVNFNQKFYQPIKLAKAFKGDEGMTLKSISKLVREKGFPEKIIFQKVTEYLFNSISSDFITNIYSVQGKGHVDWHFELSRVSWSSARKNIAISAYLVWDTYDFSLVIKTSPLKYKPLSKLSEIEKKEYIETRDKIKEGLKIAKHQDWKLANYYLQIAQMKNINDITLEILSTKMTNDLRLIGDEIDRIMK